MPIPVVPPVRSVIPLIGYGDVEQTLVEHLRSELASYGDTYSDAHIQTRYPEDDDDTPRPDVLVLVRRVGGVGPRFGVDLARIDWQVWHRSDTEAHDLAHLVRALLHRARGVGHIRGVREAAGPVPIPDTDTGRPRYLGTVDLTLRGATL